MGWRRGTEGPVGHARTRAAAWQGSPRSAIEVAKVATAAHEAAPQLHWCNQYGFAYLKAVNSSETFHGPVAQPRIGLGVIVQGNTKERT